MSERFCKVCRYWHSTEQPWPADCHVEPERKRSDIPSPMLIADHMEPVQSQLDGKMYDSKAALRATYKQAGVVELGNDSSVVDPKPRPKVKADRKEIRKAVDTAFSRVGLGA